MVWCVHVKAVYGVVCGIMDMKWCVFVVLSVAFCVHFSVYGIMGIRWCAFDVLCVVWCVLC